MAQLVTNQSALMAQHTSFLHEMAEIRRDTAASQKRVDAEFAEIREKFELIMALLMKHEAALEKLPEAIREKIGYAK